MYLKKKFNLLNYSWWEIGKENGEDILRIETLKKGFDQVITFSRQMIVFVQMIKCSIFMYNVTWSNLIIEFFLFSYHKGVFWKFNWDTQNFTHALLII